MLRNKVGSKMPLIPSSVPPPVQCPAEFKKIRKAPICWPKSLTPLGTPKMHGSVEVSNLFSSNFVVAENGDEVSFEERRYVLFEFS